MLEEIKGLTPFVSISRDEWFMIRLPHKRRLLNLIVHTGASESLWSIYALNSDATDAERIANDLCSGISEVQEMTGNIVGGAVTDAASVMRARSRSVFRQCTSASAVRMQQAMRSSEF